MTIHRTSGTPPGRLIAVLCLVVLLSACAGPARKQANDWSGLRWPPPPEQARFRYVTTLRNHKDIERGKEETRLRDTITGVAGAPVPTPLKEPYAIVANGGRLYVSDIRINRIHVFDIPRGRYFTMGYRFEGKLAKPLGMALREEALYVADVKQRRVVVYDPLGLYQRSIGDEKDLTRPTDVALSPDGQRIYVVDTGGVESQDHRIVVFDHEGKKLFTIGKRGSAPGEFNLPVALTIVADGTLYVLDAGNFRVQALDPDGKPLRAWGTVGNNPGQFARPKGIAHDRDGNIYVVDAAFGNVQVFDPEGRLLLPMGKRDEADDRPGRYGLLTAVDLDEKGYLYLLDRMFKKIDVIQKLESR